MISHLQRAGWRAELAYSTERRAAVLKKLEPPNAVALRQLAKEEEISEATLHIWRRDARSKGRLLPDADTGPDGWASRGCGARIGHVDAVAPTPPGLIRCGHSSGVRTPACG